MRKANQARLLARRPEGIFVSDFELGEIGPETLIRDLMEDQYSQPTRIVAFNTAEGWSRDVTMDIADELRRRFAEYDEVPVSVQEFLETASRAR